MILFWKNKICFISRITLHYIYCYIQSIQSKYVLDQDHFCEIQKIIFHDLILFFYTSIICSYMHNLNDKEIYEYFNENFNHKN